MFTLFISCKSGLSIEKNKNKIVAEIGCANKKTKHSIEKHANICILL